MNGRGAQKIQKEPSLINASISGAKFGSYNFGFIKDKILLAWARSFILT